jgi:hypothetical protein
MILEGLFYVKDQIKSRNREKFPDVIAGIDDLDLVPGQVEASLDLDENAQPGAGNIFEVPEIKGSASGDPAQDFLGRLGFAGHEHTLEMDDSRLVLSDFKHLVPQCDGQMAVIPP